MKGILKRPVEVFGHDCSCADGDALKSAIQQQYCKFIRGTCVKPRKSQPKIKVGICTVGATVNRSDEIEPVIICPQRFKEDILFETIRTKYLSGWSNVKWVQEVSIGVGGNVDFVAVETDGKEKIKDFLCVEIQAGGTTGSPYPYVEELREKGHFSGKNHLYGINWANEFSKTMMQQAYKKGKIVAHWKRKIVFVVQDVAMKYLANAVDCSGLVDFKPDFPVDFCSFSLERDASLWKLKFQNVRSTTMAGINRMLGGTAVDDYPSEEEFKQNILRKGIADGVFHPDH